MGQLSLLFYSIFIFLTGCVAVVYNNVQYVFDFSVRLEIKMMPITISLYLSPLQLMDKECYRDIEKIKTIGSTYMAAVGLVPTAASKVHMQYLYLEFLPCACEVLACFKTVQNAFLESLVFPGCHFLGINI